MIILYLFLLFQTFLVRLSKYVQVLLGSIILFLSISLIIIPLLINLIIYLLFLVTSIILPNCLLNLISIIFNFYIFY